MVEEYAQQDYGERFFADINTRIRDMEEKQRLLRDKMLLIGEGFIKERDKNFAEIQEMKKTVIYLKEDNRRLKELIVRVSELVDKSARKEELMVLQRQLSLFRNPSKSLTRDLRTKS